MVIRSTPARDRGNEPPLWPRSREVLLAYGRLGTCKAVAYELGISEHTVKNHLDNARQALDACSSVQALYRLLTAAA